MESENIPECDHNPMAAPVSMEWRVLAAIYVMTSAFVVYFFLNFSVKIEDYFGYTLGDKPLPAITTLILTHGFWIKIVWGSILLGIGIWIVFSKNTLPFFYGAIAVMASNLLLIVIGAGMAMPFLTWTTSMGPSGRHEKCEWENECWIIPSQQPEALVLGMSEILHHHRSVRF